MKPFGYCGETGWWLLSFFSGLVITLISVSLVCRIRCRLSTIVDHHSWCFKKTKISSLIPYMNYVHQLSYFIPGDSQRFFSQDFMSSWQVSSVSRGGGWDLEASRDWGRLPWSNRCCALKPWLSGDWLMVQWMFSDGCLMVQWWLSDSQIHGCLVVNDDGQIDGHSVVNWWWLVDTAGFWFL